MRKENEKVLEVMKEEYIPFIYISHALKAKQRHCAHAKYTSTQSSREVNY